MAAYPPLPLSLLFDCCVFRGSLKHPIACRGARVHRRACIFVPKPGVYAIALYHDENANQSFDRTGVGFPAEGFGFSNNPPTIASIPSFRSVRLNIAKSGLSTRIHLKYP